MSNFLAVATVTATLGRVLTQAVAAEVPGAQVSTERPRGGDTQDGAPTVTVFLYQVTPNPGWRNLNVPTRAGDGGLVDRPRAALDLHYLLSFSGNETKLEPQRMLGSVVHALESRPVLSRQIVNETVSDRDYLSGSDLADEVELVKFTFIPMSLDELSKLWSVFFQVKYTLSVAYLATVVLIEGKDTPRPAIPVKTRKLYVVPFQRPQIDEVIAASGRDQPIYTDGSIAILGRQLQADIVSVRIAGEVVPVQEVTESRVDFPLTQLTSGPLSAGIHGVQVVHEQRMGEPEQPHRGMESNVGAFVVRPRVKAPEPPTVSGAGATPRSGTMAVDVDPEVTPSQRAVLFLSRLPEEGSQAYAFPAAPRQAASGSLSFPFSGVAAGNYLVQIHVDGADSLPDRDTSGAITGPTVAIQ